MQIQAWTNYPIREFGDENSLRGPIRAVTIIQYDGGETAKVLYDAMTARVQVNYLYVRPQRSNETPAAPTSPGSAKLQFPPVVTDSAYIRIKKPAWYI